ncbi:unnamed protein product [Microthlaspi erraticum]|uniref:DUF4283 domain-containing protein n=1 Tax=Microthlaspi erraticum TaxID=1685480 RepID=A0A6D2K085_9BRAS|nr:unnamed protein product [Microthlaspi erraticum]
MGDPPPHPPPIPPDLFILNPSASSSSPPVAPSRPDTVMGESSSSPTPPIIFVSRGSSFTKKGILGASPPLSPTATTVTPLRDPVAKTNQEEKLKSTDKSNSSSSRPKVTDDGFNWATGLKSTCKIQTSTVPVSFSSEGIPRVKVPNVVFERGAEIHSDYIVGIFYGSPPSYGKIWGVLNFLWGKDKRVTIHNLTANAFLFRIPSASLRKKVLQHELWRVGDSPFFVTQWKASFSLNPPSLRNAPIWATISNIPFDLITDVGLGIIARPLGEVVDSKPFTSVNSASIKVVMDLTKPLTPSMELERDDGEIITLTVTYPWLPPLCSVCNELGHKETLCPKVPKPPKSRKEASSSGLSVADKANSGEKSRATSKETKVTSENSRLEKPVQVQASKGRSAKPKVDNPKPQQIYVPVLKESKFVVNGDNGVLKDSILQADEGKALAITDSRADVWKKPEMGNRFSLPSAENSIEVDAGFTLPTRTSPARKMQEPVDTLAIVSRNAFDSIANEEEDQSDVEIQDLVVHQGSSLQFNQTPFYVGSPRGSKKKRKLYSKNSPISGGDLPLTTGGRHKN